jgi:hypothetical protein
MPGTKSAPASQFGPPGGVLEGMGGGSSRCTKSRRCPNRTKLCRLGRELINQGRPSAQASDWLGRIFSPLVSYQFPLSAGSYVLPGRWGWWDRPMLCDACWQQRAFDMIRQRHPNPSCGGHRALPQREPSTGGTVAESLTSEAGIRKQHRSATETAPEGAVLCCRQTRYFRGARSS